MIYVKAEYNDSSILVNWNDYHKDSGEVIATLDSTQTVFSRSNFNKVSNRVDYVSIIMKDKTNFKLNVVFDPNAKGVFTISEIKDKLGVIIPIPNIQTLFDAIMTMIK